MSIYGIVGLAIVSCVLIVVVKEYRPEFALIITIVAGVVVLPLILTRFSAVLTELKTISQKAGIKTEYMVIMLKGLGICYLTQFSSDMCRDFGQTSLASKIELSGKITLAALSIPLLLSIVEIINTML